MAIGDQFSGLNMKNLIGGPLSAAAEASVVLAQSTANFINEVGFDKQFKTRNVAFKYNKTKPNDDGSFENQEVLVEVPLLAIVPIPNLQIDNVNILFDMEVKQCEKSEESLDAGGSFNASAKIGPFSISISGSVSSHSAHTRSTDNSAKYHVDVTASNHGTPEGLSRVLDMMAANVSPLLIGSVAVDAGGKALAGKAKEKNDALKALRSKQSAAETSASSTLNIFDQRMKNLMDACKSIKDRDVLAIHKSLNGIEPVPDLPDADKNDTAKVDAYETKKKETGAKQKALENSLSMIDARWQDFTNRAKSIVDMYAAAGKTTASVTEVCALQTIKSETESETTILIAKENPCIAPVDLCFVEAIKACKEWQSKNSEVDKIKAEYSAKMME